MDDGSGKMLKPSNLQLHESGIATPPTSVQAAGLDVPHESAFPRASTESAFPRASTWSATPRASTTSAAPGGSIAPGARVRVVGLQARTEVNGQLGQVVEWDEPEARWKVRMMDGSGKMFRPCNLELTAVG